MSDMKIYHTGQKPGKGSYQCIACPHVEVLEDSSELPICPICQVTDYFKIS